MGPARAQGRAVGAHGATPMHMCPAGVPSGAAPEYRPAGGLRVGRGGCGEAGRGGRGGLSDWLVGAGGRGARARAGRAMWPCVWVGVESRASPPAPVEPRRALARARPRPHRRPAGVGEPGHGEGPCAREESARSRREWPRGGPRRMIWWVRPELCAWDLRAVAGGWVEKMPTGRANEGARGSRA